MKFLALILSAAFILTTHSVSAATPAREAAQLERAIDDGKLVEKTERALSNLIITAAGILRKKGFHYEAAQLENEWFNAHQYDLRVYALSDGLGDHGPLSMWLKQKLDLLTFILGVELMKKTHLIDLAVFNHAIPVVFKPCGQPWSNLEEYRRHFSKDENYQESGELVCALLPVTSYWLSYGGCVGASMGTGYAFACGTVGNVVQKFVCNVISDRLSDRVFERACGN